MEPDPPLCECVCTALLYPKRALVAAAVVFLAKQCQPVQPYLEGFQRHKCHLYVLLACAKKLPCFVVMEVGKSLQADFVT